MAKDKQQKRDEHQLHKNETDKRTIHLENEEIERMPDTDDDYRLPRELPEEAPDDDSKVVRESVKIDDDEELMDDESNVSPMEIALLEDADMDTSSDESRSADLLENTDDDGDELNEGPDDDNLFDTGEDLDVSKNMTNPDTNKDEEDDY